MRGVRGYDYIIIGSGSAGSVVARRLSEDPQCSVLLVEAGGSDATWKIRMPSAYSYPLQDPRYSWCYQTEPQANLGGRRIAWPAGRVLGGSSSINGMVFLRGHPDNFDAWEAAGATGWSYADVLPYFKAIENRVAGADIYRGGDGPLSVSPPYWQSPLFEAFVHAGAEAGYPQTVDFNGATPEGFGPFEMTVDKGVRASTYRAFVEPVASRRNLTILTNAAVTRVLIERGRAIGIQYLRNGTLHEVRAGAEVILSGGAIHSPRLLLLSGIGAADDLARLGIPVAHDLPGVGHNLQDHLELYVQFECTKPVSLYPHLKPLGKVRIGAEWFLTHSGLCATNHAEAGALIRSSPHGASPDIQMHFVPMAIDYHGHSPSGGHSFQCHVGPTLPTSTGTISLTSADPSAAPRLDPNYLSTEADRAAMRRGIRLTREIIAQPAMQHFAGPEIAPGRNVITDADLDTFVQQTAESGYHYCGTCQMGDGADVRPELLDRIVALLNADVVPFAPGEGSVGYLAVEGHIAMVLIGEGQARVGDGPWLPGSDALAQVGIAPLLLVCKEGLALLNGTTSVTAQAVLALHNAMQAAAALDVAAALSFEVLRGTPLSLDPRLHATKAHPEQARIAAYLSELLADSVLAQANRSYRLQDFYALRAAPQMHGAAASFIAHARKVIEDELASSGDNPVIVATHDDDGIAISGGNFDGSYVGLACDSLVTAMTMLAKVSERRSDRMVNSHFSELPAFLVREPGLNSGYMIVQYTAAGLVGEMRSLSMPASVDTVPTCGNQEDPVSFAYNAAAKALRVSRKFEWVVAVEVLTACQGLDFIDVVHSSSATRAVHALVRSVVAPADSDRAFYPDMVSIAALVRSGAVRNAANAALITNHQNAEEKDAEEASTWRLQ